MTHNAVMQFSIFYVVDPGLSPGAIAGIVVAAVVVLLLVATTLGVLIGVCVVCKKRPVQGINY